MNTEKMNTENINTENINTENINTENSNLDDNLEITESQDSTSEKKKAISFDVSMTADVLYDYLVHHAYSSAGGILGTCFGFMGVLAFFQMEERNWLFLILGLVLIFYMPINLKYKSVMQMKLVETFKKPLHYDISSEGITVSQGETSQNVAWDQCYKAVSTRLSIVVYTGKRNASVFPRKDLGDNLPSLIAVISENMDPKKIKIRY